MYLTIGKIFYAIVKVTALLFSPTGKAKMVFNVNRFSSSTLLGYECLLMEMIQHKKAVQILAFLRTLKGYEEQHAVQAARFSN